LAVFFAKKARCANLLKPLWETLFSDLFFGWFFPHLSLDDLGYQNGFRAYFSSYVNGTAHFTDSSANGVD
jgi:hypothetical protein